MPSIGNIYARLGLETDEFDRQASESGSKISNLGEKLRTLVTRAGTAAISLGAVGAALAVNMVRQGGEAARQIEVLTRLSNTNTEQFQKNAYAAKQFGIEQEKLADIYKDTSDKLGDFLTTGAGPLADFFEKVGPKVGVTADEFRNLSGPDALQLYVKSLEKANVSQSEMTFYMEAIASDSALLLPLLKGNAAELNRLGAEAETVGAVLSDIDLQKLVDGKEAIDRLQSSLSGLANVATATFAPAIQAIAEGLSEELAGALEDSSGDMVDWGDVAANILAFTADAAASAIKVIGSGFSAAGQTIGAGLAEGVARIKGETEEADAIAQEWRDNMSAIGKGLADDGNFSTFRDRLAAIRANLERMEGIHEIRVNVGLRSANLKDTEAADAEAEAEAKRKKVEEERAKAVLERERALAGARLAILQEFVASEAEAETMQHEQRLKDLDEAEALGLEVIGGYQELREQLEADHMKRLEEIRKEGLTELERLTEMSYGAQASAAAKYLAQMTAGAASESRALFEINKVAATAQALIDAKSSILSAYKFGTAVGGPYVGAAFAAVAAATTAAQVSAIQSASYGSSGGVAPSLAGSTPAPPVSPVGGEGGGRQVIAVEGLNSDQLFTGGQVRNLLAALQDAVDDGAKLVIEQ